MPAPSEVKTYQSLIRTVRITVWIRSVNCQGHTIRKNCQQNQVLKRSRKKTEQNKSKMNHEHVPVNHSGKKL